MNKHSKERNKKIRILISIVLIMTGLFLVAVFVDYKDKILPIMLLNIGVALVVAGIVALFNELLFVKDDPNEKAVSDGLRLMESEREGFSGYYHWALDNNPKKLKFSGHAVLKSMDDGFKKMRLKGSLTDAFINQLKNGAKIYVMFFDPRWEMVEKVTTDMAGKNKRVLYERLNAALDITKELYTQIDSLNKGNTMKGELKIKLTTAINNQYAYHYVEDINNERKEVYLGFYFSGTLGGNTPMFTVDNRTILGYFDRNFDYLFTQDKDYLLSLDKGILEISEEFDAIKNHVNSKLSKQNKGNDPHVKLPAHTKLNNQEIR